MPEKSESTITDGTMDFSGGANSIKVTTVASTKNPNGLARNELAWMVNCTCRDGGLLQRTGWQPLGRIYNNTGLYQGGIMYDPGNQNPYLLLAISGQIFSVNVDNAGSPTNKTAAFPGTGMPNTTRYSFVQAENFVVIQANDFVTLPRIYNGNVLRVSKGITNPAVAPGTPGVNEIPPAGAMDYYMGRLWYAQGRQYSAGDIVGGTSGTAANQFRDAVLNVTENPLVLGGDGFTVPDNSGNIRAIFHNANLNTQLGQGSLFIGTRKAIYSLSVPVTRTSWIAATDSNQPLQTVVQLVNGPVNDWSVAKVNGDVFYQTLEPAVQSLFSAIRYFNQWANPPVSAVEERILQFNDRSLLQFASAITFDNRLLNTALPIQKPQGVIHQGLIPLDFVPISSFAAASSESPTWEGSYSGLDILQLFTGDFGGRERAFAVILSQVDSSIWLYELTDSNRFEEGDQRVTWLAETPAFTWGKEFDLKKLVSAELAIDKLFGTVDVTVEYRPDFDNCWHTWHKFQLCSARNTCEDVINPVCYPVGGYREGFRQVVTLPKPPFSCETSSGRPSNIGYQFQLRLTFHGWCRLRSVLLHAEEMERKLYAQKVC
jgi:hypothetical protein